MIDRITARRAALSAQISAGRLVFADLEAQRDGAIRALADLQRSLDSAVGGVRELDALLRPEQEPIITTGADA